MWEWNEKLNLTRHTDYEKLVTGDVVDSQMLEQFLDAGQRVLDVGTGGGVPGVVLAILRPDLTVEPCESMAKKARAVEGIVHTIGLDIPVHHARAETLLAERTFDTLVVRAVAPLAKLLTWFGPHWDAFGRLLIIKGPAWVESTQGGSRTRFAPFARTPQAGQLSAAGHRVGERCAVDRAEGAVRVGAAARIGGDCPKSALAAEHRETFNRSSIHGEGSKR